MSIAILTVNALLYVFVVATGGFPFDRQGTAILPDFMAHLTGGALVASGQAAHLYDIDAQRALELGITRDPTYLDVFLSPPLSAYLYAPFARLSYGTAVIAWTSVTSVLLAFSARLLGRLAAALSTPDRRLMVLAFLASQPVIQVLGSGQDTAISLLLWTAGVRLALARRDAASGLLFSLGLFKPQLFLFPPLVFLLLRRRVSLACWVAGALTQIGLTLAVFGEEGFRGWWRILHSLQYEVALRAGRGLRMASVIPFMQSIVPDSARSAAGYAGCVLCVGITVATVARCIAPRTLDTRGAVDERAVWALACVATLLVTPHLFYYDLALLIVPVALLLDLGALTPSAKNALLVFSLLTWTAAARAPFESAAWPLRARRLLDCSTDVLPMARDSDATIAAHPGHHRVRRKSLQSPSSRASRHPDSLPRNLDSGCERGTTAVSVPVVPRASR